MLSELEDLMVEVVEETPNSLPESMPESTGFSRFSPFGGGAYSEPPPRVSDVRELRRDRGSDEITQRAYELWDAAGRPTGQDKHFWFLAEAELSQAELSQAELGQTEWHAAAGQ